MAPATATTPVATITTMETVRVAMAEAGHREAFDSAINQRVCKAVSSTEVVDSFVAAELQKPETSILSDAFPVLVVIACFLSKEKSIVRAAGSGEIRLAFLRREDIVQAKCCDLACVEHMY
jgi:hypothetical protein